MEKELEYVVFEDFTVNLLNDKTETNCRTMFYISSKWYNRSGGLGLLNYYENRFFNSEHKEIELNKLIFDGFYCVIDQKEFGRPLNGNTYYSSLRVEIQDKLEERKILIFKMCENSKNRFDEIFKYIKYIKMYGTHIAATKVIELENTIQEICNK